MTLEQLRVFVAVAERLHVTKAARALNLAQSAASHAIAALEARYDTKLFNRVGRRIELTEAGQVFLIEARAVLARAEAAQLALSEYGNRSVVRSPFRRARRSLGIGSLGTWSLSDGLIRKSRSASQSATPRRSQRRWRVEWRNWAS